MYLQWLFTGGEVCSVPMLYLHDYSEVVLSFAGRASFGRRRLMLEGATSGSTSHLLTPEWKEGCKIRKMCPTRPNCVGI